jgi:hypothetical protein
MVTDLCVCVCGAKKDAQQSATSRAAEKKKSAIEEKEAGNEGVEK